MDYRQFFVKKLGDNLRIISLHLEKWKNNGYEAFAHKELIRIFHNIKSNAGFVDLPAIVKLAAAAEKMLDTYPVGTAENNGLYEYTAEVFDQLLSDFNRMCKKDYGVDIAADLIERLNAKRKEGAD